MRAKEFISELGIGGQFISGLTGGQATNLKDLGKLGAAAVGDKLGLHTTAGNIRSTINPETDMNKIPNEIKNMPTKELADSLGYRVGNTAIIGQQRIKITAINSDGIDGIDLQSHMPVSYPKEALAFALYQQQQGQHE
jgi:hypothetical protein